MRMRLPGSSVQIHPEPSIVSSSAQQQRPTCTICHAQVSAYTCPTCNIPYCSLACFKNEKRHGGCVGAFRKRDEKAARESVKTEGPDDGEREKVMEMLRKWQLEGGQELDWEAMLGGEGENEGEAEDESQDGENHAITEADLPTEEADLLALLDEDQRNVFLDAMKEDGQSATSRAQQLWGKLHATSQPWWMREGEQSQSMPQRNASFHSSAQELATSRRASTTWQTGVSWNLIAVLLAYAYILQYLDVSSLELLDDASRRLARELFATLAPHVTSPRSTVLLGSASEVTLYMLDNLGDEHRSSSPSELMLHLLEQVEKLCSSSRRRVRSDDEEQDDGDGDAILLALQDIHSLFHSQQPTIRKLIFYAAHYIHGTNLFHDTVLGNLVASQTSSSSAILNDISQQVAAARRGSERTQKPRASTTIHTEIALLQQEVDDARRQDGYAAAFAWQAAARTGRLQNPDSSGSRLGCKRDANGNGTLPSSSSSPAPLIQPVEGSLPAGEVETSARRPAAKDTPTSIPQLQTQTSPAAGAASTPAPPRFKSFQAARDHRRTRTDFKVDRPGSVVQREGDGV